MAGQTVLAMLKGGTNSFEIGLTQEKKVTFKRGDTKRRGGGGGGGGWRKRFQTRDFPI